MSIRKAKGGGRCMIVEVIVGRWQGNCRDWSDLESGFYVFFESSQSDLVNNMDWNFRRCSPFLKPSVILLWWIIRTPSCDNSGREGSAGHGLTWYHFIKNYQITSNCLLQITSDNGDNGALLGTIRIYYSLLFFVFWQKNLFQIWRKKSLSSANCLVLL